MRWPRAGLVGVALGLVLAAGAAGAEPPQPRSIPKANKPQLNFAVTVLQASPTPGAVDPRAERFDRLLRQTVRYESLHVVEVASRRVELNEIETIALPGGNVFRFRPIDAGEKGVLVAVDWQKATRGDFRLPRGKPLILGGQPYEGGQLVVILEAE